MKVQLPGTGRPDDLEGIPGHVFTLSGQSPGGDRPFPSPEDGYQRMKIRFWGTRGSLPTPGPDTARYGGNTACVEVLCGTTRFILDAGTGIRALGDHILETAPGEPVQAHLLLSHTHWDHIQGLPFFRPGYAARNRIPIYGCHGVNRKLEDLIRLQMAPDWFPVEFARMTACQETHILGDETLSVDDALVRSCFVNHTSATLAYRIEHGGHSVCYVTDNEPCYYRDVARQGGGEALATALQEARQGNIVLGPGDRRLADFVRKADVLIHDSQYSIEDYREKIHWGHSFYLFSVELALRAEVSHLFLFHHDPKETDRDIDGKAKACYALLHSRHAAMKCDAAREGATLEL